MNNIKTPVTAFQNDVVHQAWYVQDIEGKNILIGTEEVVKEAVDLINRVIDTPPVLGPIGDEDPVFMINDDGAEFLAAIGSLEEHPTRQINYLGWLISGVVSGTFFSANKGSFAVCCKSARDIVTAVYTLEINGVVEPAAERAYIPDDTPMASDLYFDPPDLPEEA